MDKLEKDILALIAEDSRLTGKENFSYACPGRKDRREEKILRWNSRGVIVSIRPITNTDSLDEESVEALI